MKKFTLVIDPSSRLDGSLYIFEARTVKEAKIFFDSLKLDFAPGITYCATIGKKEKGNNRYHQILRTDNGIKWYRDKGNENMPYNPEKWQRVKVGFANIKHLQKQSA
jgi:hypothetical protein